MCTTCVVKSMDAQQVEASDNTVLCIALFMILMTAVLWQTRGMKVLRAEFMRGFHEDLESRTPAEVKLERLMRVHRIDTLFRWLFARLALPLLTLCLLPPTRLVYLALCTGPRWNAVLPVGIAVACKALAKLQPHSNSAEAEALQLEAITVSLGIIVISFLLYQALGLLKLVARAFNIPRSPSHKSSQAAAARPMAGAYARQTQTTGKQRRQAKQAVKLLALSW